MALIFDGRYTARLEHPLVLFLIGMRLNKLILANKWLPVLLAMPRMLKELQQRPDAGLLSHRTFLSGRTILVLQYWESFEKLVAYAHATDASHFPAWAAFNREVGKTGTVGIWHQTYAVEPGKYETVYADMPRFGLASAAQHVPAVGGLSAAKGRMTPDLPPRGPKGRVSRKAVLAHGAQKPRRDIMADFFREVDEDVRRDQLLDIWKRYQNWIIGAAVLVVIGTGGWRFFDYQRLKSAEAAGGRYAAAEQLLSAGKNSEAAAAFAAVAADAPAGYATLAQLARADALAAQDPKAGAAAYDEVAANGTVDPAYQEVARLRGAYLRVDSDDPKAFEQHYAAYAGPDCPIAMPIVNFWRWPIRAAEILAPPRIGSNSPRPIRPRRQPCARALTHS